MEIYKLSKWVVYLLSTSGIYDKEMNMPGNLYSGLTKHTYKSIINDLRFRNI